jgi:hypothetical protein
MKRKKWTLQEEVTDALLKVREKKKWQLALRRYIIEKQPTPQYAPYFGLPTAIYRQWIELQFTNELNWDNFGKAWQFEHIVPVVYFDYSIEEDLKLCWSFINIRVEKLELSKARGNRVDVLAVKAYFEQLYMKTRFELSRKMIDKIAAVEVSNIISEPRIEGFIIENTTLLNTIDELEHDEFNQLNAGIALDQILLEREILKKFGV